MEKRGLGRGLAALIADTLPDDGEAQVREVPLDQVVANPYQPRTQFDAEKMEELVDSIREHGILQPVLLRRIGHTRYQLVAGERRFRAAQTAGLSVIPALVKECSDREMLEMAVVENVQRADISPMEAARAYRRLIDEFGMTQERVAQRVGKNRVTINNTLRLLKLPAIVQESLEKGEITEGHARALLMAETEPGIVITWEIALKKGLSVRETERLARRAQPGMRRDDTAPKSQQSDAETEWQHRNVRADSSHLTRDPNEQALVDRLQEALQTKVTVRHTMGDAGRIEIDFYSSEDLERIIETILLLNSP